MMRYNQKIKIHTFLVLHLSLSGIGHLGQAAYFLLYDIFNLGYASALFGFGMGLSGLGLLNC